MPWCPWKDEILKILFGYLNFLRQLPEFPKEMLPDAAREP